MMDPSRQHPLCYTLFANRVSCGPECRLAGHTPGVRKVLPQRKFICWWIRLGIRRATSGEHPVSILDREAKRN